MSQDDGASPAVCPRCGRVDVDCEDAAARQAGVRAACMVNLQYGRLACGYPLCACNMTPLRALAAIRAFLGCPQ